MKVYCKKCKYQSWDYLDKCFDGVIVMFLGHPNKTWSNKNNNCPHYKRKWWKFWIKNADK